MTAPDLTAGKAAAAAAAVAMVEDGMLLGLGTGSTAAIFLQELGARVAREGLRVAAVPTSLASERMAEQLGIPLVHELSGPIDLAVDGADEVDPDLRLIKGRGGALVREKLVASAAQRFVVVADASKLVDRLGAGVLPVEIVPFLWRSTARRLEAFGCSGQLRGGEEEPFVSDNGNLIVDLTFPGGIDDPERLGLGLKNEPGVVEHGLFIGLTTTCLVGSPGGVRRLGA